MFYHMFLKGADFYLFLQGAVYHHTRYGKRPIPKFYQPNSESNGMFVLCTFTLTFCYKLLFSSPAISSEVTYPNMLRPRGMNIIILGTWINEVSDG